MNAEALKTPPLPYNGDMIRWAREWRGRTVQDAAIKLGIPDEKILAWEAGSETPTVRQARALAEFYGRAFLEFFYEEKPEIVRSSLIPDYRLHRGAKSPEQNRELLEHQHWAEAQRINALDLFDDIDEQPPTFPEGLFATIDDDVEMVAIRAREAMGFTIEQQKKMSRAEQADMPGILRSKMETIGVLVLRENELARYGVSGLCIVQFPLPIVVYATEAPGRSAFTLLHELAHVILRESGISGGGVAPPSASHSKRVERWCDKFAAAFLVPRAALAELRGQPTTPQARIDDETLGAIARVFRVSSHAMLIRLVDLGYVDEDYYWKVRGPQFRAEEEAFKASGRSTYWASRKVNSLGNMYTGLVLEAWGTGRIPFHQAAEFMGLKNYQHMLAIRQEFGGA